MPLQLAIDSLEFVDIVEVGTPLPKRFGVAAVQERALGYRVSLAGGINRADFATAIGAAPEIVVVGRVIAYAKNPAMS